MARPTFARRVWTVVGIIAFVAVLLLLLGTVFRIILLLIASLLVAVFFHGFAGLLHRKTGFQRKWCLPMAILITLGFLYTVFWLVGSRIQEQIEQISETLPGAIQNLKAQLLRSEAGEKLVELVDEEQQGIGKTSLRFFNTGFGVITDLYIILIASLFFTASPGQYTRGALSLVAPRYRARFEEVLQRCAALLRGWLKGQLFAMLIIFTLTGIGLMILGIPMSLGLATIAGFFNFIPNFGPLIALIPGALIGFLQSPGTALIVIAIYTGVQIVESVITPIIQNRMIKLPPALIILFQVVMGYLAGAFGVIMATPFLVILKGMTEVLYLDPMKKEEGAG
jgi:predicted PurR-regulated permease PerM